MCVNWLAVDCLRNLNTAQGVPWGKLCHPLVFSTSQLIREYFFSHFFSRHFNYSLHNKILSQKTYTQYICYILCTDISSKYSIPIRPRGRVAFSISLFDDIRLNCVKISTQIYYLCVYLIAKKNPFSSMKFLTYSKLFRSFVTGIEQRQPTLIHLTLK